MHDRITVAAIKARYASGECTPRDVIQAARERVLTRTYANAWIEVLSAEALDAYIDALPETPAANMPLWGIPFAIKDNIDLAGVPTTAACPAFSRVPTRSATVVQRLIAAGAIPLGKTNMDQFATGLVGVRSPYGEVPNAILPEHVSGGSSSGSAWAVATGEVCFSLGTDTAGSGRVPAAFNGLFGAKPTRGWLSTDGVVPACRSLDCVSVFANSLDDLEIVLSVAADSDTRDPWSRTAPVMPGAARWPARIGVPKREQWQLSASQGYDTCFEHEIQAWRALGCDVIDIDATPLLDAARELYEGPWVAERDAAFGAFVREQPDAVLPVLRTILAGAADKTATAAFESVHRLQAYKAAADRELAGLDAVLIPTAPCCPTRAEVARDPIGVNSRLGTWTNFMNLLDYAALAIPAGVTPTGVPFGVTVFGPAFSDLCLRELAALRADVKRPPSVALSAAGYIPVAVCGAHLEGMPLNGQLTSRGAVKWASVRSAPHYRFYALAGGPPFRPGMVRVSEGGGRVAMEVWGVPEAAFGSFVAGIPAPLGIGKVELEDGRQVPGFICEPAGLDGAEDITAEDTTAVADWRRHMAARGR